jgi:predicted Zn-dependent protease
MKLRGILVAALLVAGCVSPDAPDHTIGYQFKDAFGDVFNWPTARVPVRYWADPRGDMAARVQRAIGVWQNQFMYGEYRGVLVSDSTHADVIVQWSDSVPPEVTPDNGPPVKACGGLTAPDSLIGPQLFGAFHTSITILLVSATAGQVEACVRRTLIHELGHSLGLFPESPDSTDIMYVTPFVSLPSRADMITVQVLYHTPPNVLPPQR